MAASYRSRCAGSINGVNVIDRYRRWNQLAYLSPSERRLNRGLWALLAIALVYAFLQHVALANIAEAFQGGQRLGSVCYDLAIAYAGAFTFYLLNIRVPLRRDRRNIYRHVGYWVNLIVTQGNQLIQTLNKTAEIEPSERENAWETIEKMCGKISLTTQAEGWFIGTKGLGQHTVFTVIVDNMNRTRAWINQILSHSSYLATELIDLLSDFELHTHFRTTSEHVSIAQSTGMQVGNKDMSLWAHQIFNYAKLIRELDSYAKAYLSMTRDNRPGLMTAEDNPSADTNTLAQ